MNNEKAFSFYRISTAQGDGDSCAQVGDCFQFGVETKKNVTQSVLYYSKGYHAGNIKCRLKYGSGLFYGWTMPSNPARGFKLLTEASEAEDLEAATQWGQFYECGIQVGRRSTITAFQLMKSAYKKKAIWSGRKLARYYELPIGVERNQRKAAEIYDELYKGGGVEGLSAQGLYGLCLIRGIVFRKNIKEGWRLIQAACAHHNGAGSTAQADCYRLDTM